MLEFQKWLDENWEKDNMLPPCLDAQKAIDFLCDYLLGENYYAQHKLIAKLCTIYYINTLKDIEKNIKKELGGLNNE